MTKGFLLGVLFGLAAAFVVAPRVAEARPPPGVLPIPLNGKATQIGVVVTDGGYTVVPVKVDGGALTMPVGKVVRIQCSASACIGTSATTSCGGISLAENAGRLVAANTDFTTLLADDTGSTISVMTPSGGTTCPVWELR